MAYVTPTTAWQSAGPLAVDEIWYCWDAPVLVDNEATPANRIGAQLEVGQSFPFAAGMTVYYTRAPGAGASRIARIATST